MGGAMSTLLGLFGGLASRVILKLAAMAKEPSPDAAPISTEFHSTHIERLKEALDKVDVNDEQAKVEVEIEASKVHWSELASVHSTVVKGHTLDSSSSTSQLEWVSEEGTPEWKLEVAEDNVHMFRSLQEKYPSGFFIDENDLETDRIQHVRFPKWLLKEDGVPLPVEFRLSSEMPFAEGGQAELFHAHVTSMVDGKKFEVMVMKVFKEGIPLRDLLKLFPHSMLADDYACIEGSFGGNISNCNIIFGARLLKSTGRFAFLMARAWGDLRKLIDERMLHFNNQGPPFPNYLVFYIIYQIAQGMQGLHASDIIHRDLKASNVLVFGKSEEMISNYIIDPIHLQELQQHHFICQIADFECSVGVMGTRFWRAPEILEGVKNRNINLRPELFTKQADVYSFGMTCYEILSGGMPFEELKSNDYDGVIGGARPMLPSQTVPWLVDLVNRCWHKDPSMRPPFEEIVEIIKPYDCLVECTRRVYLTR